ncbi:MAG: Spermine synthase [Candidatus Saccharibacteria bacterium]|nr:Spermine synthase [Candidatus Saccharibacteria bacterium]
MNNDGIVYDGDTAFGHFRVADTVYGGRPARVLYSGNNAAAQSGVATDDNTDLLFDYNQRFLELIETLQPQRILLIGGGAFTLPKVVVDDYPDIRMDVVELDAGLPEIAQQYFDFTPTARVQVHIQDGREFLETVERQYDLILLDAFFDATTPRAFQTLEAALAYRRCLQPEGVLAINTIAAYYGVRSALLRRQIAALQTQFQTVEVFPAGNGYSLWLPQNFILMAQNGTADIESALRHSMVALPAVDKSEAVHDGTT